MSRTLDHPTGFVPPRYPAPVWALPRRRVRSVLFGGVCLTAGGFLSGVLVAGVW